MGTLKNSRVGGPICTWCSAAARPGRALGEAGLAAAAKSLLPGIFLWIYRASGAELEPALSRFGDAGAELLRF